MTNAEAISEFKKALAIADRNDKRYIDLLETAIRALEQPARAYSDRMEDYE